MIARNDTNRHPELVSGSITHPNLPLKREGTIRHAELVSASHNEMVFSLFTFHFSRKRVAFTLAEGATHVDTCDGKRKIAFTLAEVLITLGIIGVVVALTIPTIATKYRKYVLLNKIEHTYTLLNNTLERAKVDYGTDINQWEISEGTKLDKSTFFVENYMLPYLNVLQYCGSDYTKQGCFEQAKRLDDGVATISPTNSNRGTSFILNNGTYIYLEVGRGNDSEPENTNRIEILFDVDGPDKGKNIYGYDVFDVELGGDEGRTLRNSANKNKFLPYSYDPKKPCDYYVSTVNHGCNKDSTYGGSMCLAYIFCNGWDFGDKYIW